VVEKKSSNEKKDITDLLWTPYRIYNNKGIYWYWINHLGHK